LLAVSNNTVWISGDIVQPLRRRVTGKWMPHSVIGFNELKSKF